MPGGYHNDGSGRDSYVNNACLTETRLKAIRNVAAADVSAFWPSPTLQRERARHEHLDHSRSPQRLPVPKMVPSPPVTSRRGVPRLLDAHSLEPLFLSPARLSCHGSPLSTSMPIGAWIALSPGGMASTSPVTARKPTESESHSMMRNGRTAVPSDAPLFTGRLPNVHARLHKEVGVFNEYC